jgi:glycosyltransferase involved in cell wall biosynthesis
LQTYQDFEVIVVDDGSTDNSIDIVQQYNEPRLHVIRQDNAGPGAARNRGIKESNAAFLAFLDADDEWMPEFLEKSFNALEANPDCDLTTSASFIGPGRTDRTPFFRKCGITEGPWRLPVNANLHELRGCIHIFNSDSTLCRRKVVEQYGGFYMKNGCAYGEDYYLWLQIMFNHKICRILEPLSWFHSEVSEYGLGRETDRPLDPFLTDTEAIRSNCPEDYRDLLETWLARYALSIAHRCIISNSRAHLSYLVETFPLMRRFRFEYFKLKLKMLFPILIPYLRYMRQGFFAVYNFVTGKRNNPDEAFR